MLPSSVYNAAHDYISDAVDEMVAKVLQVSHPAPSSTTCGCNADSHVAAAATLRCGAVIAARECLQAYTRQTKAQAIPRGAGKGKGPVQCSAEQCSKQALEVQHPRYNVRLPETQRGDELVHLLRHYVAKNFDLFEMYSFRNLLDVPQSIAVKHGHIQPHQPAISKVLTCMPQHCNRMPLLLVLMRRRTQTLPLLWRHLARHTQLLMRPR